MEVTRSSFPARRYLAISHHGPYPEIGNSFEKLFGLIGPLGIEMAGPPAGFWYDDPESTPVDELRSDAAVPVGLDFELDHPDLHLIDVPEGEFLVSIYSGPYSGLPAAWSEFSHALEAAGGTDWDWCFEEYLNDHTEVPEAELQTRLVASAKSS
jgi:AraC family transcriptional regulator